MTSYKNEKSQEDGKFNDNELESWRDGGKSIVHGLDTLNSGYFGNS